MLGRKGVLISDPSVSAMTDAQWVFEYRALQAKRKEEIEDRKEVLEVQQRMLKAFLGLDIVKQADDEVERWIPLSLICGNPDLLKTIFEENEREEGARDALNDPEFDEWSERLAKGELDETDLWPVEDSDESIVDFTPRTPRISFDED